MAVTKLSKHWISFRCADELEVMDALEFHGLKNFKIVYDSKAGEYVIVAPRSVEGKEKEKSVVTVPKHVEEEEKEKPVGTVPRYVEEKEKEKEKEKSAPYINFENCKINF